MTLPESEGLHPPHGSYAYMLLIAARGSPRPPFPPFAVPLRHRHVVSHGYSRSCNGFFLGGERTTLGAAIYRKMITAKTMFVGFFLVGGQSPNLGAAHKPRVATCLHRCRHRRRRGMQQTIARPWRNIVHRNTQFSLSHRFP